MWPHHLREHLLVAGDNAACMPGEIDKAFQIVNNAGNEQVHDRLLNHVVGKGLVGIAVNYQHVHYQHCLPEDQ